MKSSEAMALGFMYTGLGGFYHSPEWQHHKDRAMEIKKTYKGADYKIVDEDKYWKGIYGNEIFSQALYFNPAEEKKMIEELLPEQLETLRKNYEKSVAGVQEDIKKRKEKYDFLMSLRKM